MKKRILISLSVLFVFLSCVFTRQANAYIGPGVGLSAVGAFLSLIAGGIAVVFGFIWYPIRRLMKKRKKMK